MGGSSSSRFGGGGRRGVSVRLFGGLLFARQRDGACIWTGLDTGV